MSNLSDKSAEKKRAILSRLVEDAPFLDLEKVVCPICGSRESTPAASGIDFEYFSCRNIFQFDGCAGCGAVYLKERPRRIDLPVIYPKDYYYSAALPAGRSGASFVRKVWDIIEEHRVGGLERLCGAGPKKVLDVGCGSGRFLGILKRRAPRDWELFGVDFNGPTADELPGVTVKRNIYEDEQFGEGKFDLVIAQQMIEHSYDPSATIRKIYKELAPGGYAVFDTPDYESLDRKVFNNGLWSAYHFPRHTVLFTEMSFRRLAENSGFRFIRRQKLFSPVGWVVSFRNMLLAQGASKRAVRHIGYGSLFSMAIGASLEAFVFIFNRHSSNMRLVIRKPATNEG